MANGANEVQKQLRTVLENYIKSQYFGKSPILLDAIKDKLDQEGLLYKKPYIESSPAYQTLEDGILKSKVINQDLKDIFKKLIDAKLGVYKAPFVHQVQSLEDFCKGQDLFVSTGTGSGKTECFMWPLMAKILGEAKTSPNTWKQRGVRTIVMYPMNALVSDQVSRLRRLLGDCEHKFINIFREACGNARRPQFGMYTGRTPYPGSETKDKQDEALANTYHDMLHPQEETQEDIDFINKLKIDGKLPAKEDLDEFIDNLMQHKHIPNENDAELITRFEMQQYCPDILITNYSMLEYMLIRKREENIWTETKAWLNADKSNKLLFVIDEAHMYRGSSGGEVSLLLRRLFYYLGIDRSRVQFILTTASMPNSTEEDVLAVNEFFASLTATTSDHKFSYITGLRQIVDTENCVEIPTERFLDANVDTIEKKFDCRFAEVTKFFEGFIPSDIGNLESLYNWLYVNLPKFTQFSKLLTLCRGQAISLKEIANTIFEKLPEDEAYKATNVLLAIALLAKDKNNTVLFPARMHMLFRGLKGVYACTNPSCPNSHENNGIKLGEIFLNDGRLTCPCCHSAVYELYNDRRCGALFFKGFVLKEDLKSGSNTYFWHYLGNDKNTVNELHLYIPEAGFSDEVGRYKICYLDVKSGQLNLQDDSCDGKEGYRKLYYQDTELKGKPNLYSFTVCPHCKKHLSSLQLSSFNTRGNQSFFNLIKEQFDLQPPVEGKTGDPDRLPNEGRKVLLFSDSRQRAAALARDMSAASDTIAARQILCLAIKKQNNELENEGRERDFTLDKLYDLFCMSAYEKHAHIFHDTSVSKAQTQLQNHGAPRLKEYLKCQKRGDLYDCNYSFSESSDQMKEQLIRFYCGYNTLVDSALSWIEPIKNKIKVAKSYFEEDGLSLSDIEFKELFNAWALSILDTKTALGNSIEDNIRCRVRPMYFDDEFGISQKDRCSLPKVICNVFKITDKKQESLIGEDLCDVFLKDNAAGKYYLDLNSVIARFDLKHKWYRCRKCSEITPYTLKGHCPWCGDTDIYEMTEDDLHALDFWRKPVLDAIDGKAVRVIDTEEHTAQLSHKDQRDSLWSKTESYELRFQDFLKKGEAPVDILSSTTTMEVGIDIGSLVAVGLRNIPPMRENYQQRAGRAGRRGASLSTIVTFCADSPHDNLYFEDPAPMFRGEPRRPWIDIRSEKIVARHLSMIALQSYLVENQQDLDSIKTTDFYDNEYEGFKKYLKTFNIEENSILVPETSLNALEIYKKDLIKQLDTLEEKRNNHAELYEKNVTNNFAAQTLLDSLYDEGVIPTYSFPKNVVSAFIFNSKGKVEYQLQRGLDVGISEYAPGRSIVVDKTTYQIGGLYYPAGTSKNPASNFIDDKLYSKTLLVCFDCGWMGLEDDFKDDKCPSCGCSVHEDTKALLKPWGFAPKNAKPVELAQLEEEYSSIQQPQYSTVPKKSDVKVLDNCKNIKVAVRSDQRLIMINKGVQSRGFVVCCSCGAAMPIKDPDNPRDSLNKVDRPYINLGFGKDGSNHVVSNNDKYKCDHSKWKVVNLGYDFVTDMLVMEFELDRSKLNLDSSDNSWLRKAGVSLAEAIRLAACKELDIEFTELVTGYRLRFNKKGDFIDIYLYDSLSSGAGYAVGIEKVLNKILEDTKTILKHCDCESACYKCLKHYRNQYMHGMLDRNAALDLLEYGMQDKLASPIAFEDQQVLFDSIKGVIESSGVKTEICANSIKVLFNSNEKNIVIYPSMLKEPSDAKAIYVSKMDIKYNKPNAVNKILKEIMNSSFSA